MSYGTSMGQDCTTGDVLYKNLINITTNTKTLMNITIFSDSFFKVHAPAIMT